MSMQNVFYYYRMHEKCGSRDPVSYISNEKCLRNFMSSIDNLNNLTILIDNSSVEFVEKISSIHSNVKTSTLGNGRSFIKVVEDAIKERQPEDIVYFVENDYLHLPNTREYLEDGFSLEAHYVTLYDHPDKYTSQYKGLQTNLFEGALCYWRTTPSTCMTFASKIKYLKLDLPIIKFYADTPNNPSDHQMFLALGKSQRVLLSPINSRCTHGESGYEANFIDWAII